jgi:hypothetical protein
MNSTTAMLNDERQTRTGPVASARVASIRRNGIADPLSGLVAIAGLSRVPSMTC